MFEMNILAIAQSRMDSPRLRREVMNKMNNQGLIDFFLNKLSIVENLSQIVVATTIKKEDDDFAN